MRRATKILATGLFLSTMVLQVVLLSGSVRAATLTPKYMGTAITIDGTLESAWEEQQNTVFTNVSGNVLKMHVAMFQDWIYFALEYRTDVHHANETFALACANVAPDNSSVVVGDIFTYDAIKCVRFDGRSYDLEVVKDESRFRNNTIGNFLLGNNFKVAKNVDNHTIYEFRFMINSILQYPERFGDVVWEPVNTYTVTLFFGNTYKNETYFRSPDIDNWGYKEKVGITINEKPEGDIDPEIEALELNILVGQVTTFIIAGCVFGYVGVYIKSSGSRIKRRW